MEIRNLADFDLKDNTLIIKILGELDHHCANYVKVKTDKIMMENNVKNIVFDFEETEFMDSSGIGVIMGRYKNIMYLNGKMFAVNINPSIDRILKISGLYKIINKKNSILDIFKEI